MIKHRLTALLLTGALALTLATGALASSGFTDLSGLQPWGVEAVDYVTGKGLMNGTGANAFNPNGYADRSMVATLIWRIAGKPTGNITGTFSDVPLSQWYSDAIDWAAEAGIVNGANGKFRPFEIVTRQDLAVMLYRYEGSPASDVTVLSWYQDYNEISSYAANAVAWAVSAGILSGDGTSLMPQNGTTRVQLAAILMRFLEKDADADATQPPANSAPEATQPPAVGSDAAPSGTPEAAPADGADTPAEQEPQVGVQALP